MRVLRLCAKESGKATLLIICRMVRETQIVQHPAVPWRIMKDGLSSLLLLSSYILCKCSCCSGSAIVTRLSLVVPA